MKKLNLISLVGLIVACLLMLFSFIRQVFNLFEHLKTPWLEIVNSFTQLVGISIFLILRYMVVIVLKQVKFRIVMDLIILFGLLGLITSLIVKHNTPHSTFEFLKSSAIGLILLACNIWFFVSLLRIQPEKIRALIYLQIYVGLGIMIPLISAAIPLLPFIKSNPAYYFHIIQPLFTIGDLPLLVFFYKSMFPIERNNSEM